MIWIFVLPLVFTASQAEARSADCSLKDKSFSIENNSLPDKKDRSKITQNLLIKSAQKQTVILKNGNGEVGFINGGDNSVCTGTAAYILNDSTVALLFGRSNPPYPDKLMMVVYDAKADRVLKIEKDLGTFSRVDAHQEGFFFSTMIPRPHPIAKNMKSPLTEREMTALDEDFGAFQVVKMQKKKLVREFDPLISWDKSDWRRFFKDEKDFLEGSGWDKTKKTFKYPVVYKAEYKAQKTGETSETCIQLAEKRDSKLDPKKWRCTKD